MVFHLDAVLTEQLDEQLTAQHAQVAGEDHVVAAGGAACVLKVGRDGGVSGGSHGRAHVVGVGDPLVHDLTHGDVGDIGPRALPGQDGRSGGCGRPLGGGGALAAILQGGAVLPLRRAEVGGGGHCRPLPKASVQSYGGQGQPLPHGGAGPVQAKEGHLLFPGGEGGADALIQKVAGKEPVQGRGCLAHLVQGQGEGLLLHGALRLLPGGLAEGVVPVDIVEGFGQGALPLLLARHVGPGG